MQRLEKTSANSAVLWAVLSLIVGTVLTFFPVTSILFHLVEVPKNSVANTIMETYSIYRDHILGYIPTVLSAIGRTIDGAPSIAKDIFTLYLIGMGAMFFSSRQTAIHDETLFKSNPRKLEKLIRDSGNNIPGNTTEKVEIKWLQVKLSMMSKGFRYIRYAWVALKWPAPLARNVYQYLFAKNIDVKENGRKVVVQFAFKLVLPLALSIVALILARFF